MKVHVIETGKVFVSRMVSFGAKNPMVIELYSMGQSWDAVV